MSTTPNPPNPGTPEKRGPIGVDQWVAQADERREGSRASGGRIVHLWRLLPPAGKLALLTPAIAVPFLPFVSQGNLFNYGIFILIYALLALGLNVVVGFAGLLDLGYVAFFGFGAYIYAFLSGTHSEKGHAYTHHWDAQYSIPVVRRDLRAARAVPRLVVSPAARRLPRDRHPLLRPGVRACSPTPPTRTGSPTARTASPTSTRSAFFGGHVVIDTTRGYYWFLLGVVVVVLDRAPLHQRVANGTRLEGLARRIRSPPR